MATIRAGVTKIDPQSPDDVSIASGGTLDGSNVLQVNYDDTAFDSDEGKSRLILALRQILHTFEEGHTDWPAA